MKKEKKKRKRKAFPGVQTFPYVRRVLRHVITLEMAAMCSRARHTQKKNKPHNGWMSPAGGDGGSASALNGPCFRMIARSKSMSSSETTKATKCGGDGQLTTRREMELGPSVTGVPWLFGKSLIYSRINILLGLLLRSF